MKRPTLVIIGGANGSGKTTLANEYIERENLTYLGADDIAREINPQQPDQAAIEAGRIFRQRLNDYLQHGESLVVESTLAGQTLKRWIVRARDLDYSVLILFVYVDSPELCVERIATRVAKGEHSVPEADVRRRFPRANWNFWHTYKELADEWNLFYNSAISITQIAGGSNEGAIIIEEVRFKEWEQMVAASNL